MQSMFAIKEIIWAKVKGYPWWPAEIAKLPTSDNNVFKVVFIAEDTHAFLNPRDVRKYGEFYDECSKKKMRGLTPAIQIADEIYKKRTQTLPKSMLTDQIGRSPQKGKSRGTTKSKVIKKSVVKTNGNRQKQGSDEQELQLISEQQISQPALKYNSTKQKQQNKQQKIQQQYDESEHSQSQEGSVDQQKFINESEQKIDRSKIESVEDAIYKHIEEIKQSNYKFSIEHYKSIASFNLTDQQLLHSKITNMLSFIISNLKDGFSESITKEKQEFNQLVSLQKGLKERIITYLNDTSYYDQYLKLIQRNKKNRNQYENRLIYYLKNTYKIKKELSQIFASRLMTEINNGALVRQKELLEDIKEHKVEIGVINNKSAIDRSIEMIIPKYM